MEADGVALVVNRWAFTGHRPGRRADRDGGRQLGRHATPGRRQLAHPRRRSVGDVTPRFVIRDLTSRPAGRFIGMTSIRDRVDALDWAELREQLDRDGHAITPPLLDGGETDELSDLFDGGRFRSTIDMARHRFGEGRYRYFDHPLPDAIAELRGSFYRHLAPIANDWSRAAARRRPHVPARARGAARAVPRGRPGAADAADPALRRGRLERAPPGPLRRRLLPVPDPHRPVRAGRRLRGRRVRADGAAPARAEPRARAQAAARRVRDLPDPQRPNRGRNGYHRVGMRHGVGTVTRGRRTALGVIFHDAR